MKKIFIIMIVSVSLFSAESKKPKEDNNKNKEFKCEGKKYCKQMTSCAEAKFYLNQCGLTRLDRDKDGIPCETICK